MSDINKFVGARLLEIRELQGFTQEDLAEILGCTRQNYIRLEKGKGNISVTQLFILCTTFEMSPAKLLPPIPKLKKEFNEIRKAAIKTAINNNYNTNSQEEDNEQQ
ncbi:MAG: helix-turn-helix domain-containing protein [Pseudobacter sp.]|uniref:helix-turn-helix domain-containing protein n=1 Tax=Pseudobacter sp. TaxID=2045420 RepID=UPI003F81D2BF